MTHPATWKCAAGCVKGKLLQDDLVLYQLEEIPGDVPFKHGFLVSTGQGKCGFKSDARAKIDEFRRFGN